MNDEVYWLALQQKYWMISPEKLAYAIQKMGSIQRFWNTDKLQLFRLGLNRNAIERLVEYRNSVRLELFEKQLEQLKQEKIEIITYIDDRYPSQLKKVQWWSRLHAPRLLFHKGSLLDFNNCISIIGTRKCSEQSRRETLDLSSKLVQSGYTIVSGLASGIDTMAHEGALRAGGKTIAVLPWMEPIYPPENIQLSNQIIEQGCLISECYRRQGKNLKWRFIERNKIISGISKCVVIMETGATGGSIHLAEIAFKQKQKIFVFAPQDGGKSAMEGYRLLLKKYLAKPIKSHEDLSAQLERVKRSC